MGLEKYSEMIQNLLPVGWAWPRQKATNMEGFITALAGEPERVDIRVSNMLDEAYPLTTNELLTDWERALGLPETCEGLAETIQGRRQAVYQKLSMLGNQSPAYYIDVAAKLGYTITITEFTPFRAGVSRAGDAVYGEEWAYWWQVNAPAESVQYFLAGQGTAGSPLATWGNTKLECVLNRLKPAHTNILFSYDTEDAVSAWAPTDLPNLIGWWDASDTDTIEQSTVAGRVSRWLDKSGNDNHLSQNTAANEPVTGTITLNGRNVIAFDGATGLMYLSPDGENTGALASIDTQDLFILAVFKQDAGQESECLIGVKSSNPGDLISPDWRNTGNYYGPDDAGNNHVVAGAFTQGQPYILGIQGEAAQHKLYSDGTLLTTESVALEDFDRFLIGKRPYLTNESYGYIAELVVCSALSEADRALVEGYVAARWGL